MNWVEVLSFYLLPLRSRRIRIVLKDGRVLNAPSEYPFESIVESLLDCVYTRFGFEAGVTIDVGSSIGDFVVSQSKEPTKWFVFEPNPEVFSWLTLNLKSNNLEERVIAYNSPVSVDDMISICDEVSQIDFLKMDCEGCEYELLDWPDRLFDKISRIAAEVHNIGNNEPSDISAFLSGKNFDVLVVPSRGNTAYLYATRKTKDVSRGSPTLVGKVHK